MSIDNTASASATRANPQTASQVPMQERPDEAQVTAIFNNSVSSPDEQYPSNRVRISRLPGLPGLHVDYCITFSSKETIFSGIIKANPVGEPQTRNTPQDIFFEDFYLRKPVKCSKKHLLEGSYAIRWIEGRETVCPEGAGTDKEHLIDSLSFETLGGRHKVRAQNKIRETDSNETVGPITKLALKAWGKISQVFTFLLSLVLGFIARVIVNPAKQLLK